VKSFISLQQKRLSDPGHDEIIAQAMPNAQLFKKRCTSAHEMHETPTRQKLAGKLPVAGGFRNHVHRALPLPILQ
jgi:hypothetical protein